MLRAAKYLKKKCSRYIHSDLASKNKINILNTVMTCDDNHEKLNTFHTYYCIIKTNKKCSQNSLHGQ